MQEQLVLLDLKLDTKLNEVVLKREGAEAAFVDSVKQLLQRPKSGAVALEKVLDCVPILEQSGNYALANQVCELIQTAYKDSPTADLRQYAQQRTDLVVRRLNLLGKPLSVEGTLLSGAPLDFAPYQGKVVLLAFWSSISPPCRPELLAVKSVYEKYHAKGFEVIGVCLDQDRRGHQPVPGRDEAPLGDDHQQQAGRAIWRGGDSLHRADRRAGEHRGFVRAGIRAGSQTGRHARRARSHVTPQHQRPDSPPGSSSATVGASRKRTGPRSRTRGPVYCSELVIVVVCLTTVMDCRIPKHLAASIREAGSQGRRTRDPTRIDGAGCVL